MSRNITRRDFVAGVGTAVGGAWAAPMAFGPLGAMDLFASEARQEYYPPIRTGMRGSHPGSFEAAHATRDGASWEGARDTGEEYDLVVVGGGLSGLAAAYFYREATGPDARILVLDNHDDFGGHAKRNEFVADGETWLVNGGSSYMVRPATYPEPVKQMLADIGVELNEPTNQVDSSPIRDRGMTGGVFFDQETFGEDRLVANGSLNRPTREFLQNTPLSERVRDDLMRIRTGEEDYLPQLDVDQKIRYLQDISYRDYLVDVAGVHPDALLLIGSVWALSQETASAWFAYYRGAPGFQGLGVPRPPYSPEASDVRDEDVSFPAGNSDIARLIVRSLIPESLTAGPMADVILDRVDYSTLDRPDSNVRIRLNSIAVHVRHVGERSAARLSTDERETEVTYVNDGELQRVRSRGCVLACNNSMIPYLCPELPETQKEALLLADRAANMMTNVLVRDWRAFESMGISGVDSPGMFYNSLSLRSPRQFGPHSPTFEPSAPAVVGLQSPSGILHHPSMVRGLLGGEDMPPGLSLREQLATLRAGLLRTSFEDFERRIRSQMARVLSPGGFDPARDILAITINRWPHGFAMGTNSLFDPADRTGDEHPTVVGRQPHGRISIANSDSAGLSLAQAAMGEAYRAVHEIVPRNYGYFNEI